MQKGNDLNAQRYNMDLKDIALFRAIVISGSLSGAGRQMRMTPMAVSRRLAVLETEVGARLVHRTRGLPHAWAIARATIAHQL